MKTEEGPEQKNNEPIHRFSFFMPLPLLFLCQKRVIFVQLCNDLFLFLSVCGAGTSSANTSPSTTMWSATSTSATSRPWTAEPTPASGGTPWDSPNTKRGSMSTVRGKISRLSDKGCSGLSWKPKSQSLVFIEGFLCKLKFDRRALNGVKKYCPGFWEREFA